MREACSPPVPSQSGRELTEPTPAIGGGRNRGRGRTAAAAPAGLTPTANIEAKEESTTGTGAASGADVIDDTERAAADTRMLPSESPPAVLSIINAQRKK